MSLFRAKTVHSMNGGDADQMLNKETNNGLLHFPQDFFKIYTLNTNSQIDRLSDIHMANTRVQRRYVNKLLTALQ